MEFFSDFMNCKEPSIKDVRSQEGGAFVQCRHRTDKRGSSDADVCTFWCKTFGSFEIYGVSTDKGRGLSIADKRGEGQFFAILCGRLLWMALNQNFDKVKVKGFRILQHIY